jgi:hypothetical protein
MARYRIFLALTALLLTLPALLAAEAEEEALAGGRIPCTRILAKSAEENGGAWSTSFHASRTTDLTVAVFFPKAFQGEHELELRFYTPRGNLYQSIRVPIAEPGRKAENRPVKGYPMAIRQVVPKPEAYLGTAFFSVEIPFPVGGTLISTNSLYGQWRIEALVDQDKKPCGKPAYLQIEE